MLESHQVEELISLVSSLDKATLTRHFLTFRGNFPIDFTPEYLDGLPIERLRHIFVALCLQAQRLPIGAAADAEMPTAA
jgi:hypothetical protein